MIKYVLPKSLRKKKPGVYKAVIYEVKRKGKNLIVVLKESK